MPFTRSIEQLIALPAETLRTTTAFSLAALAAFGLSFGAAVQTTYEKIWGLPPARWCARWRHAVWLAALIGVLLLSATTAVWRGTRSAVSSRCSAPSCSCGGRSGCCAADVSDGALCCPAPWPRRPGCWV